MFILRFIRLKLFNVQFRLFNKGFKKPLYPFDFNPWWGYTTDNKTWFYTRVWFIPRDTNFEYNKEVIF